MLREQPFLVELPLLFAEQRGRVGVRFDAYDG
jgi:hypothetical protein